MAEKRVSVRLSAVGGRQVRAELEGVGEAGSRGFGRLSREMEAANARLAGFARRVRVAAAAGVAAATAAGVAMVRSGLRTVDAQAKLAQSLETTVASIQTLERAGELAGVSMSGVEQATKDLTRRLSQAAAGSGPAADALDRLGLSASQLLALPLDARVGAINAAIEAFVPAAERAAVAGRLFGEEGSIAMSRIDTATLRRATEDVRAFGVVVSEQDADRIERTNDAISRLGLVWRGLSNQLAVAAAPALEAVADAMAAVASRTGPLGGAIRGLFENVGRLASYAAAFAAFLAGRWVAGLAAAALSVRGLATALVVLRGALIRTGIGALVVGAGELIHRFARLVSVAGGFGAALARLGDVAEAVWRGIRQSATGAFMVVEASFEDLKSRFHSVIASLRGAWSGFVAFLAETTSGIPGLEAWFGGAARTAASGARASSDAALTAAQRAGKLRRDSQVFFDEAFAGVADAVAALGAAATGGADDAGGLEGARVAAEGLEDALAAAGAAASATGAALEGAGAKGAAAAEKAAVGWDRVREGLGGYADEAGAFGARVSDGLTSAFRRAEDALASFVTTGKGDFRGLIDAMVADLARLTVRQGITGPLARLLGSAIGSVFAPGGGFASSDPTVATTSSFVNHAGGIAGIDGARRTVPAALFAGARRYHAGGMVGLAPDEVPAILQRGERVLSRREAAAGSTVTVRLALSDDLDARIETRSRGVAVETVRDGIGQYDRNVLPARVAGIRADPRRR